MMSSVRYCKLRDAKVIIAPERLQRPSNFSTPKQDDDLSLCPFEPGSENATPNAIYTAEDKNGQWTCRVFPNLYKALSIEEPKESKRIGFFTQESGLGAHEVIVETPHHDLTMNHYTLEQWHNYLKAISSRIKDLSHDSRLAHIQIFKNHGASAGATLKHPHSQIIATAFIPPEIESDIERQRAYFKKHHRALLIDMVQEEKRESKRVIYENSAFIAFTPFASLNAFEVIIAPKEQKSDISTFHVETLKELSRALQDVYKKLYAILGDFDFNMIIKNPPIKIEHVDPNYFYQMDQFYTFHIQIIPRLYTLAGYEFATGMRINPILPEIAAQRLKEEKN